MDGNSDINNIFIPPNTLDTAVLFIVFNRFETTREVFDSIKKARPPRLYIASDGARPSKGDEDKKVKKIREYIIANIDWKCDVKTLFREENIGCRLAVSGAISWFFRNEEMGIILEDDCLPSQSFFWFCEEMLKKYKNDKRIFYVTGYNSQNVWNASKHDYFFSHIGSIWGWATWRRSWNEYDINMGDIDDFIENDGFINLFGNKIGKRRLLEIVGSKTIDTWDYQFSYVAHKNNALACIPSCSLIKNIGFGEDATHTFGINNDGVTLHDLKFPLRDNVFITSDSKYISTIYKDETLLNIFIKIFKKVLKIFQLNILWNKV
jgi:hypothetical protein